MTIHETAVIHPNAKIDETSSVGPFCIIGEDVEIGPNCILHSHVVIKGPTSIGPENIFFQAEDGIRDRLRSRGLGDVYKRQEKICKELHQR